MARAGAILGISGGAIALLEAIYVLVILHFGTGVVAFTAPPFRVALFLIMPPVLSLLAIPAIVYRRKNYRLSGLLIILIGVGIGVFGSIGYWAAALLLICGGILFVWHGYRTAKRPR